MRRLAQHDISGRFPNILSQSEKGRGTVFTITLYAPNAGAATTAGTAATAASATVFISTPLRETTRAEYAGGSPVHRFGLPL